MTVHTMCVQCQLGGRLQIPAEPSESTSRGLASVFRAKVQDVLINDYGSLRRNRVGNQDGSLSVNTQIGADDVIVAVGTVRADSFQPEPNAKSASKFDAEASQTRDVRVFIS